MHVYMTVEAHVVVYLKLLLMGTADDQLSDLLVLWPREQKLHLLLTVVKNVCSYYLLKRTDAPHVV